MCQFYHIITKKEIKKLRKSKNTDRTKEKIKKAYDKLDEMLFVKSYVSIIFNTKKDFEICFRKKTIPQVTELLTNYGDIDLIWFDTPQDITKEQSVELYNLVKKYQPNCLINSRIGNGMGDYGSSGDNETDAKGNGMLYEVPATLNDTWGYKAYDQNWKDAETVLNIKNELNARGINYLLNVGPDPLGRIPARSVEILKEIGRK